MGKNRAAFLAFVGIWFLMSGLILREELGIFGVFGLQPITYDAVQNPVVFVLVALMFFDLFLWWLVHWYRRKYGDLAKKWNTT